MTVAEGFNEVEEKYADWRMPDSSSSELETKEDLLGELDKFEPLPEMCLPKGALNDVLSSAAEVGRECQRIIDDQAVEPESATTFNEMLDTTRGDLLQRLTKLYIKPTNPEKEIALLKFLQVDHFQNFVKSIVLSGIKLASKITGEEFHEQTNYTLGDGSLNSMVDFASNQTTFNEIVHIIAASFASLAIEENVMSGQFDQMIGINMAMLLVNLYCVLSQRYSRDRLCQVIDKALARNKDFFSGEFKNALALRLPKS